MTPNRTFSCVVLLATMSLWLLMGLNDARAQAATTAPAGTPANFQPMTTDGKGGKVGCNTLPETQGGTLLGVIVPCVTHTIKTASQNFSAQLIAWLNPLLYSYITLVLVLFGVKTVGSSGQQGGIERLRGEAFLLVFKVAMVIGMLQMVSSLFIPAAYSAMTESQSVIANAINNSASGSGCPSKGGVPAIAGVGTSAIWIRMDCVLGNLYGFTTGSGGRPNMLLMSSAFGFAGGFLFGGSFGIALFLACVGVLWSIFMLVIRTAVTFMQGYLYCCLLLILSPIFMPLTLLRQTQPYFQSWVKGIIASMLLPILITSYSMVALQLYDKVLFEPNSEFAKLFDSAFAQKVQAAPKQVLDWNPTGAPGYRGQASGRPASATYSTSLVQNVIFPNQTGSNNPGSTFLVPNLQMTPADFEKMFKDAIKVLITSILISGGLTVVMSAAARLTGSLASASLISASSPIDQALKSAKSGAHEALVKTFATPGGGSASGAEFVTRLGQLPTNVTRGFFNRLN